MKRLSLRVPFTVTLVTLASLGCGAVATEEPAHDAAAAETGSGECAAGEALFYKSAGCGSSAVGVCQQGFLACYTEYCSCEGTTISGCGGTTKPWSSQGKCADDAGALAPDAGCPQGTSLQYDEPGCGLAPKCLPPSPPCRDSFCGCDGVTSYGCGTTSAPHARKGPC